MHFAKWLFIKKFAIFTGKHLSWSLFLIQNIGKFLRAPILKEPAKSRAWRAWRACVFACLTCLRAHVLGVLACSRACVLTCSACLRACMYMLCLRASCDVCFAYLALTYSRFCLIIYFVCINQGFAIKRKLLIHVNLS